MVRHHHGLLVITAAVLGVCGAGGGRWLGPLVRAAEPRTAPFDEREAIRDLPAARVQVNRAEHTVVIELPAVDLPARAPGGEEPMVMPPVARADIPGAGYITSYRVEIVDGRGRTMPRAMLHHFNLNDPDHRELFLPISLHVLAASRETPTATVPWLLFGMPVAAGQRFIASAMLANPTAMAYRGLRVRLIMRYGRAGRPWPLFRVYPWVMDVLFPLGHPPGGSKAFDLPPGRSTRSWEARPAVPGTIIGMGGHLHDYGVSLELQDVTTGQVIGRAVPVRDSVGRVELLPLVRFYRWYRLGVRVTPDHTYRVTVLYDNPTGRTIPNGGMGALAGLFVPDRGASWPGVDPTDSLYRHDLRDTFWTPAANDMPMHRHGSHDMP
jgi:hypothetical protein